MRELHLFAGAGGGILGGILLGHTTVCAVEIEPYCRKVLLQRQRDGILPKFPIWDDVRTFDGRPWRGRIDVVCGGFPCQDISPMGAGAGISGAQSGLWKQMVRIIREVRPSIAFVENSAALSIRGLGTVLGDISSLGFDAKWGVFSAAEFGAPHIRERLWILAHSKKVSRLHKSLNGQTPHRLLNHSNPWKANPWNEAKSKVRRVDDGLAHGVDRYSALGNGQVPAVAALAWRILSQ